MFFNKRFSDGREGFEDDERPGLSVTARTEEESSERGNIDV